MRLRVALGIGITIALAVGAIAHAPAVASDGDFNHALDCDDEGYISGIKLFRENGLAGGGPIFCGTYGGGLAGRDGHLGNVSGDTEYTGIWDFNDEANSARFYWHATTNNYITVCIWSGQQGTGQNVAVHMIFVPNNTPSYSNFNLSPNDVATSVAWTANASDNLTCGQVKAWHGW